MTTELISDRVYIAGDAQAGGLRNLSDGEFLDRYGCDRFTATVLANRFRYVVSHITNQFRAQAFSPIIRYAADMCGMLSGPPELGYPMVAVSETLPLFYGSIPDAVRIVLEEYGLEHLMPGDVILVNDYYRVGTHLNDACAIRPIFFDGVVVSAVTIRAHLLDIGGVTMGGFDPTKKSTYEDGLRLPPILLYSAGKPVLSTFKLLYDNTRLGNLIIPDLKSECRVLELADELLVESIEKYGLKAYFGAVSYTCDASAETMERALARIPDGVYEGEEWIDGDGLPDSPEYCVHVKITKVGTRAEFDLRDSSLATRTAVNCTWADVKTGVAMALKCLVDPRTPVTSGTLRNIDVIVPPDALFNASPPAACQYYFSVVMTIVHAIYQALNPALGADAVSAAFMLVIPHAFGRHADGSEWAAISGGGPMMSGPWGATKHGDGDSSQQSVFSNVMTDGGAEVVELESPAVVLRCEYVPDTGGAGTYRGGASNVHDVLWMEAAEHRFAHLHCRRPTGGGGVYGGKDGPTSAIWLFEGEQSTDDLRPVYLPLAVEDPVYLRALPRAGVFNPSTNQVEANGDYVVGSELTSARAGAVVRVLTSGGGGWGDPLERDLDRVKNDVRDEYVTVEGAARDYGVVITGDLRHPERLTVDEKASLELRATFRHRS